MPSKYIEFINHDLNIDHSTKMAHIQGEMQLLLNDECKNQEELLFAFRAIGYVIE